MSAGVFDIEIEQGATFELNIAPEDQDGPINLIGYDVHMQLRYKTKRGSLASDLTTENGGLKINADNTITIYLSAAQTSLLKALQCFYDIELSKDGRVYRILEGEVLISEEVTR